jgi:hypothetical protein
MKSSDARDRLSAESCSGRKTRPSVIVDRVDAVVKDDRTCSLAAVLPGAASKDARLLDK